MRIFWFNAFENRHSSATVLRTGMMPKYADKLKVPKRTASINCYKVFRVLFPPKGRRLDWGS